MSNDRERRGAYAAGFEDGYKKGLEMQRLKKWRAVESVDDIEIGDFVKLLVPSMFGYLGTGIVKRKGPSTIDFARQDKEYFNMVTCCPHELAVLKSYKIQPEDVLNG